MIAIVSSVGSKMSILIKEKDNGGVTKAGDFDEATIANKNDSPSHDPSNVVDKELVAEAVTASATSVATSAPVAVSADSVDSAAVVIDVELATKKRKERLEQNRISARESRKRKKNMIEELQRTVITLSRENKDLNVTNESMRRNLMELGTKHPGSVPLHALMSFDQSTTVLPFAAGPVAWTFPVATAVQPAATPVAAAPAVSTNTTK